MSDAILFILSAFFGVTLHIAYSLHQIKKSGHDGTITVSPSEFGSTITLNVDPHDLIDKHQVNLKVVSPSETA